MITQIERAFEATIEHKGVTRLVIILTDSWPHALIATGHLQGRLIKLEDKGATAMRYPQ